VTETLITQLVHWEGGSYLYTWHPTPDISSKNPVTHIECVVFNGNGQILIMNEYGKWSIPGGAPNNGETYEDAIRREVQEEANVVMSTLKLIGYNEIIRQDKHENTFYHLVYSGVFSKLLPREIDPEAGIIHEIRFVESLEVTKYVKWGNTGASMFNEAITFFQSTQY
jgi:8-oxo-dGTP diphosphatase